MDSTNFELFPVHLNKTEIIFSEDPIVIQNLYPYPKISKLISIPVEMEGCTIGSISLLFDDNTPFNCDEHSKELLKQLSSCMVENIFTLIQDEKRLFHQKLQFRMLMAQLTQFPLQFTQECFNKLQQAVQGYQGQVQNWNLEDEIYNLTEAVKYLELFVETLLQTFIRIYQVPEHILAQQQQQQRKPDKQRSLLPHCLAPVPNVKATDNMRLIDVSQLEYQLIQDCKSFHQLLSLKPLKQAPHARTVDHSIENTTNLLLSRNNSAVSFTADPISSLGPRIIHRASKSSLFSGKKSTRSSTRVTSTRMIKPLFTYPDTILLSFKFIQWFLAMKYGLYIESLGVRLSVKDHTSTKKTSPEHCYFTSYALHKSDNIEYCGIYCNLVKDVTVSIAAKELINPASNCCPIEETAEMIALQTFLSASLSKITFHRSKSQHNSVEDIDALVGFCMIFPAVSDVPTFLREASSHVIPISCRTKVTVDTGQGSNDDHGFDRPLKESIFAVEKALHVQPIVPPADKNLNKKILLKTSRSSSITWSIRSNGNDSPRRQPEYTKPTQIATSWSLSEFSKTCRLTGSQLYRPIYAFCARIHLWFHRGTVVPIANTCQQHDDDDDLSAVVPSSWCNEDTLSTCPMKRPSSHLLIMR